MAEWLKFEFYAQVPDGMEVGIDKHEAADALARTFGFSRVRDLQVSQVSDHDHRVRNLINDRPSEGTPIWQQGSAPAGA